MHIPQGFDYDQPGLDTLAGIYLEVSDATVESHGAECNAAQGSTAVVPEAVRLFGLTVNVDDEYMAGHPQQTPHAG